MPNIIRENAENIDKNTSRRNEHCKPAYIFRMQIDFTEVKSTETNNTKKQETLVEDF